MKQLTVEARKIKDVRDKEQLYVIITDGKEKVVINIGEKNYQAVKNLTEGKHPQLPKK